MIKYTVCDILIYRGCFKRYSMDSILKKQLVKYILVSTTTFCLDLALFNFFIYWLSFDYRLALLISFTWSIFVNFLLCDRFVFHRTLPMQSALMRHYIAYSSSFALQMSLLTVLVSLFNMTNLTLARICISSCTFLLNFFIGKKITFY